MERIIQKNDSDCGVACVAMLIQRYAGCPSASAYDAAKSIMFGMTKADRTGTRDLKQALKKFGVPVGHRSVRFSPTSQLKMGLEFDAIVSTKLTPKGFWHWMVWDASDGMLLDPLPHPYVRPNVTHYIKIG